MTVDTKQRLLPVIVGYSEFEPLVQTKPNGELDGFEIELFEYLAREIDLTYEYKEYTFADLLPALEKGEIQVALAGITRNGEREIMIDFSHHTIDSGLNIMVRDDSKMSLFSTIRSVFNRDIRVIFYWLFLFIVTSAHLLWLAERSSGIIDERYYPGVLDAFWWSIVTVSTVGYGDIAPESALGRIVGTVVILIGLGIFSLFIGQVSSVMTTRTIRNAINKPEDLYKKKVATRRGTTSVEALREYGTDTAEVDDMEEAYEMLQDKRVDAVVFDAPVLKHYVHSRPDKGFVVTGPLFKRQSYGIALQEKSELREPLNREILKIRETGVYEVLYKKWFGEEY